MENLLKLDVTIGSRRVFFTTLLLLGVGVLVATYLWSQPVGVPVKPKSIYITYCHKNNGGGIDLYKVHMVLNNGRFTRDNIIDIEGQLATLHGCKPANIVLVNTMTIEE